MASSGADQGLIEQLQAEIERLKKENERLKARNRRWMRIAGTDERTGLPNKVYLTTALLPQQISQSNADQEPFACIMLAPDQLGEINQEHGREGGDQIVQEVVAFLKENLEPEEKLVHIDGVNFIILIPKGDLAIARRRGLEVRGRVLLRPFRCADRGVNLTMSIGAVSRSPSPPGTQVDIKEVIDKLFKKLADALDRAKKEGRDRLKEDPETEF